MRNVIDHAIFFVDRERRIADWNEGAERILGFKEEDVLGESAAIIFTPEDVANNIHQHELDLAEKKGTARDERWQVRKGGERFWAIGTVESLRDGDGRLRGWVKILRDATPTKRANEALAEKASEMSRMNQELEDFAHAVSHDLKSPLRTVANYLGLIEETCAAANAETRKYLSRATTACARMDKLIDDLLRYAKAGFSVERSGTADLEAVFRVAQRNLAREIQENGAEIVLPGPLPTVPGDEGFLILVAQNLISNAVKYRRAERPTLEISSRRDGRDWLIAVRDNGIGISPRDALDIFKPFHRSGAPGDRPGSGVGLAICKKIVERHGGKIWAEANPGAGSTFFVRLPG